MHLRDQNVKRAIPKNSCNQFGLSSPAVSFRGIERTQAGITYKAESLERYSCYFQYLLKYA